MSQVNNLEYFGIEIGLQPIPHSLVLFMVR